MKKRKLISLVVVFAMIVSMITIPSSSYADTAKISIVTDSITSRTSEIDVNIDELPSMGILRVIEMDADDVYDSSKLNSYTSLHFSVVTTLKSGRNTLTLTSKPTAGKKVIAVMRDSSGSSMIDHVSNAVTVTAGKTYSEILNNCSVTLMNGGSIRTDALRQTDTSVDFSVKLDDSIKSCTLFFCAYPGNSQFDDESQFNKRLGAVDNVTDGYTGTQTIDLSEIPIGYKVTAYLWVDLDEDFYRAVTSQALEVVDENGQGFVDYVYPDIYISDSELNAGDTKLHLTLTGDERLFKYAQEKKITINAAVGQYPDGEKFDFEGDDQISLLSMHDITEAFTDKEVTLTSPLKAGYRVRAVVYWTQNVDVFVPKGNDYEESFGRPDDSIKVKSPASAEFDGEIFAGDTSVKVNITGDVPDGTNLLVKMFDADTQDADIAVSGGTYIGSVQNVSAGNGPVTVSASAGALVSGKKLAAFLMNAGNVIAVSAPATITEAVDFTIEHSGLITTETDSVEVNVKAGPGMEDTNLYIVGLCRVVDGKTDITSEDSYIARAFGQKPGKITLTGISGLKAGDRLRFVVRYGKNGDVITLEGPDITVSEPLAENSMVINESEFTVESDKVTVTASGYDSFIGCTLSVNTGTPSSNNNSDSRTRLAGQKYTGSGVYEFTIDPSKLKGGNTIQATLYRYDEDSDRTYYAYSNAVAIAKEPVQSSVSIVTRSVNTETQAVYVTAEFDDPMLAVLYTYDGDSFSAEDLTSEERAAYVGIKYLPSATSTSQKMDITGELKEGSKLVAVLYSGGLSGTVAAQSAPVTIETAPEKDPSVAYIRSQKVTAGMTTVDVTMLFDKSVKDSSYVLYQFDGETLDTENAQKLVSGTLTAGGQTSLYVGIGRLKAGSKLQLVLTTDGTETRSNVIEVQPSPDWGTPYAAFNESAVRSDAKSVKIVTDYSDEYLSMGDDFYCDVTIYSVPADYTDDEIRDNEIWENFNVCKSVGKLNSRYNDQTKGELTVDFYESAVLTPGNRLFIKLRLPHTEWKGEEVDYVSASVPVVGDDETIDPPEVLLYNLGTDKSLGNRLRSVLSDLGIKAVDVADSQLGQTVGYLIGRQGYEKNDEAYTGKVSDTEFMLMANMPEALLDRFLAAMNENGIKIGHKAVVTAYNIEYEFHQLIDDIEDEHQTFQKLIELNNLVNEAKKLNESEYGNKPEWSALQSAIADAQALMSTEEPSYEELENAVIKLKTPYLAITEKTEMSGTAVISATKQDNGKYTVTVYMENGPLGSDDYIYSWNTGESGSVLTDVDQDKLITKIVTVTSDKAVGSVTGQLEVPAAPTAEVSASSRSLTVKIKNDAAEASANRLPADSYIISIVKDGKIVAEKTVEASSEQVVFDGLDASTEYTVSIRANSIVGESDTASVSAATTAAGGGSHHGNSGSTSGNTGNNDQNTGNGINNSGGNDKLFSDVDPASWYAEAVALAAEKGVMNGTGNGMFSPASYADRAMTVTVLFRNAGVPYVREVSSFNDVATGKYYTEAVSWAEDKGIVNGTGDGRFEPTRFITRQEFVTVLWRASGSPAAEADLSSFGDAKDIAAYASDAFAWAVKNGVITGKTGDMLDPSGVLTRAELAQIMVRYLYGSNAAA